MRRLFPSLLTLGFMAGGVGFAPAASAQVVGQTRTVQQEVGTRQVFNGDATSSIDAKKSVVTLSRQRDTIRDYEERIETYTQTGSAIETKYRNDPVYGTRYDPVLNSSGKPVQDIIGYTPVYGWTSVQKTRQVIKTVTNYPMEWHPVAYLNLLASYYVDYHTGTWKYGLPYTYNGIKYAPVDDSWYIVPEISKAWSAYIYRLSPAVAYNPWINKYWNLIPFPRTTTINATEAYSENVWSVVRQDPVYQTRTQAVRVQTGTKQVAYQVVTPTYEWVPGKWVSKQSVSKSDMASVGTITISDAPTAVMATTTRSSAAAYLSDHSLGDARVSLSGKAVRTALRSNSAGASSAKETSGLSTAKTYNSAQARQVLDKTEEAQAVAERAVAKAKKSGAAEDLRDAQAKVSQASYLAILAERTADAGRSGALKQKANDTRQRANALSALLKSLK